MKHIATLCAVAAMTLSATIAQAQEKKQQQWFSNIKLSGYGLVQYQASGQEGSKSNTFNLRLARLALDGRFAGDFYWKAQMQVNGNTKKWGDSPRLVDLFAEWQKYGFLKIKAGQFKLPFTFENPMHPIDQGFMSYSQNVTYLSGFSDRAGGHASNGRDIGIQLQGDLLKNAAGRNLLHYQVGVFNGQGINEKDVDQRKTIVGGVWVVPITGLRIGVFGLEGSFARKGTWLDEKTGAEHNEVRSLPQHRYALSAEYAADDWTFRTEYIHSTGDAFKTNDSNNNSDCTLSSNGSKADGFYALAIVPVKKNKVHVKARYDLYRKDATWGNSKTMYEIGADYKLNKHIGITAEYVRVNDRSLSKHDYNMFETELQFRF